MSAEVATKSSTERQKGDMTQGNVTSVLLLFTLPTLLTNILNQLYNMADSIIVGQFVGADALAAVGANTFITMLIVSFFVGAGVGGGVYVSQLYGARKYDEITRSFNTMYCLITLLSAIIGIVAIIFAVPIMTALDTPANIFDDAVLYFRIYCAALPGLAIYASGSSSLRSVGDAKAPLYFLIFSAICNVILNLVFVICFKMGVAGVAWATLISQYLSCILVIRRTSTTKFCKITINIHTLRIHVPTAIIIMKLGIPSAIQNAIASIGNVLIQRYTNSFGSNAVASMTSAMKLDGFIMMPAQAVGMSMSIFIGQNLAAKKTERVHKGVMTGTALCIFISVVLSVLLYIFADPCMRLFTSDAEVVGYGVQMLHILCFFYWAMGLSNAFSGVLRGAGATTAVMIIAAVGTFVRVPLTWFLAIRPEPNQFTGIFYALAVTNLIMLALYLAYYASGKWKSKTVVTIDDDVAAMDKDE